MSNESFIEILVKERSNIIRQIDAIDSILGASGIQPQKTKKIDLYGLILDCFDRKNTALLFSDIRTIVKEANNSVSGTSINYHINKLVEQGKLIKQVRQNRLPLLARKK